MIRVYTASKLSAADVWHKIQRECPHVYLHARWLKHNLLGTLDSPENARDFWIQDEEDVRHSDVVLVYAREGDHLRGALIEAGIAIALHIPVITVGLNHPDYETWQWHPGVTRAVDLNNALGLLEVMQVGYRKR